MAGKYYSGCASGILNSPDETSTPETDPYIEVKYDAETHVKGKQVNKIAFQTRHRAARRTRTRRSSSAFAARPDAEGVFAALGQSL